MSVFLILDGQREISTERTLLSCFFRVGTWPICVEAKLEGPSQSVLPCDLASKF